MKLCENYNIRVLIIILLLVSIQGVYANLIPDSVTDKKYIAQYQLVDSLNNLSKRSKDSILDLVRSNALKAYELSIRVHYWQGEINSLINLGDYYLGTKKYFDGLQMIFKALAIAKTKPDPTFLTLCYERLGCAYSYVNKNDLAKKYLSLAFTNNKKTHDTSQLIRLYLLESELFRNDQDIRSSFRVLFLGLDLTLKVKDWINESRIKKGIGILFLEQKDYNRALYYFIQAAKVNEKTGYDKELGTIYTLIAHTLQLQKEFDEAEKYYKLAINIRNEQHLQNLYISSLLNLGNLYLDVGKYDKALNYIQAGLGLVPKNESNYLRQYGFYQLYKLFLLEKNYKKALEAFLQYSDAKTIVDYERNRGELSVIEASQAVTEIEKKNKLLEYEIQLQKLEISNKNKTTLFFITVFFIAVGVVGMILWLYVKTRRSRAVLEKLNKQLDNEILERKQVEASLIKSEESYRFLAEHTPDLILHINERGRLVYVSPTCERMFGYTAYELKERFRPMRLMDKEFHNTTKDLYAEMAKNREPRIFTFIGIRKDYKTFWAEGVANPIFEPVSGLFKGSLIVVRDISERIKYEEQLAENAHQKELLLREIHHRVKNNFAILVGVMNMQKTSSRNPELFHLISELQMRVRTMSLVHELLYRSDNLDFIPFGTYLKQLSNIVASTFRSKRILVDHDVDNCILNIEVALPLGLVVNELLTNSFKYAFEDQEEGIIFVKLKPNSVDESGLPVTWVMTIGDNGKGLPEGYSLDSVTTMGSQIVKLLVAQVEGTIEVSSNEGASFRIIFKQELE